MARFFIEYRVRRDAVFRAADAQLLANVVLQLFQVLPGLIHEVNTPGGAHGVSDPFTTVRGLASRNTGWP